MATPPLSQEAVKQEKTDYMNLPRPVPYEEINREALMSLNAEFFEGMRVDLIKDLNQKFSLSHSIMMGPTEIPSQYAVPRKISTAQYEFGANFVDPKFMLLGGVMNDGRVNALVNCNLSQNLSMKANAQITSEPNISHGVVNLDYKGTDYRTEVQFGSSGALLGANYIQSVTPHLSLGGDVFWVGEHHKSGIGYAARYNTDKMVAVGRIASTGTVALSYVQKVSRNLSFASDLVYNYLSRDVSASFGYDYMFRQSRVRGKIDSNGRASAFLEESLTPGLKLVLSAELDHNKKDYKFGFGFGFKEPPRS